MFKLENASMPGASYVIRNIQKRRTVRDQLAHARAEARVLRAALHYAFPRWRMMQGDTQDFHAPYPYDYPVDRELGLSEIQGIIRDITRFHGDLYASVCRNALQWRLLLAMTLFADDAKDDWLPDFYGRA